MSFEILYTVVLLSTLSVITSNSTKDSGLTKYVPLDIHSPITKGKDLHLLVPTSGKREIGNPAELFEHVKEVWDVIVKDTETAGLIDAKTALQSIPPSRQHVLHQTGTIICLPI